jgi:hypothetical protein
VAAVVGVAGAAAFARKVVLLAAPGGRERAKNLPWAAGRLADYATGLGLEAAPEVLLHPSVAERFTRCAPGLPGPARRTLRTNLRFIGRRVVPHLHPGDLPLPRERSKQPYSPAEVSGYLALADARPTTGRRMRAAGLVCPGAGAGLIRGDLRDARGTDVGCRSAGAALVQDLHPHDRGPKGTRQGAVIANGNLYCPATPHTLLELGPLARAATPEQAAAHDARTAEAARYKLGRLTRDDADGYHRVQCPAATGKIRCPLRPASMTLDRDRPEILQPPEHPQACCTQQAITVPPDVNAKTRQKHDYPSAAWRRSYARRTGAGRCFATIKDPAASDTARGWCRLMGLTPLMLFTTALLVVRNQRILAAWDARQQENARRAAKGLPPRTRKRRRKTLAALTAAAPP